MGVCFSLSFSPGPLKFQGSGQRSKEMKNTSIHFSHPPEVLKGHKTHKTNRNSTTMPTSTKIYTHGTIKELWLLCTMEYTAQQNGVSEEHKCKCYSSQHCFFNFFMKNFKYTDTSFFFSFHLLFNWSTAGIQHYYWFQVYCTNITV